MTRPLHATCEPVWLQVVSPSPSSSPHSVSSACPLQLCVPSTSVLDAAEGKGWGGIMHRMQPVGDHLK